MWYSPFVLELANFTVEPFGEFPVPEGLTSGNFRDQLIADPCLAERVTSWDKHSPSKSLGLTIANLPQPVFGLHGCYQFVDAIWADAFSTVRGQTEWNVLRRELFQLGVIASQHTAADARVRSEQLGKQWNQHCDGPAAVLQCLFGLKAYARSHAGRRERRDAEFDEQPIPAVDPTKRDIFKSWDIWSYFGTLLLVPPSGVRTYVLAPVDVDRVHRILEGLSQARIYASQYANLNQVEVDKFVKSTVSYQNHLRAAFAKCDRTTANLVCRAFDVIYNMVLAEYANDIDDRAMIEQQKKWEDEDLGVITNPKLVILSVKNLAIKEQAEVLLQYKICPQPDFDYFGATFRQQEMYKKCIAKLDTVKHQKAIHSKGIFQYVKHVIMRSFHKKHGRMPGKVTAQESTWKRTWREKYDVCTPDMVPFEEVDDIDLNGEFAFRQRDVDSYDITKDKAICPLSIRHIKDSSALNRLPVTAKNQLADVLTRDIVPDLIELGLDRKSIFYDKKAEDKPESKKPNGRWFFEAGTDARLKQSELEESIAVYARDVPGCVSGASYSEKLKVMNFVSEPEKLGAPNRSMFVSFDLAKFSPTLPIWVHEEMNKIWSNAFGVADIAEAHRIFTDGEVHYVKGRIHHSFKCMGNDFEGFAGRGNTIYHCGVMGYAINQLRKANLIVQGGRFACLIDDGALRLTVKREHFEDTKRKILTMLEEIYSAAGLFISWDKTFVSEKFLIFLNDIRVSGRSIQPGMRAALKISGLADELIPSLPGDLAYLESTTRGAVTAAAPLMSAYAIYIWHFVDRLKRWSPREMKPKNSMRLFAFVPYAMGGFGCKTPLIMAGSVATIGLEEQVSVLRLIGVRMPELKPDINKIMQQGIREMAETTYANNPLAIRRLKQILHLNRTESLVTFHLMRAVKSPVLRQLCESLCDKSVGIVEQLLLAGSEIPVELREMMHKMEPRFALQQIARKFVSSRTASVFVPMRATIRVRNKNKYEAEIVLKYHLRK